jgi:malonate-semialdehyde dehydrogenase (acetylating)/methylmalonate-semialdehyde dehydrogenase
MVIMPDCNLRATIPALMTSFFGNAGQRCLAGQNVIVVGDDDHFYKEFINGVVDTTKKIVIGNGLDEEVQMGPVRDTEKKKKILSYIDSGIKEGAKITLDGRSSFKIKGDCPDTCFLGPTIMENVKPEMKIVTEEIFGPTMGIIRVKTLDEAIKICDDNPFHNADAIFTSNGKTAREFKYRIKSGNVGINVGIVAPMAFFPFSGMRDSFFGILHTQGKEAIRFFTESKVVVERWP